MFCPHCGSEKQEKNTYCRNCGEFLPDLEAVRKRSQAQTPEEMFKMSLVFNVLTAVAGIATAIALIIVHFGTDAHPVIYAATSLLLVISTWQSISFFNNLKLRKRFIRKDKVKEDPGEAPSIQQRETNELLPEADFENMTPASVTESETRKLDKKDPILTQTKK